jgi:hypothetical protein
VKQVYLCVVLALTGLVSLGLQEPDAGRGEIGAVGGRPTGDPPVDRSEPKQFAFDGGFLASPGLLFNFARGEEVIWSGQVRYGADEPRYESLSTLAPAPEVEVVRETPSNTSVLGSGLDHDGVTPLMLVVDRSLRFMDVFTVAGDELLQAELTGVGRNRTDLGGFTRLDLLHGAAPDMAHEPICAAVCHGLIVVQCKVWFNSLVDGDYWRPVTTSFFTSQDAGQTWELFHEDTWVQNYWDRGREWCLQNWWPMQREPTPTEAFFTSTDYRYNTGAQGGRTYLFRASRSSLGAPWAVEPVSVVYETEGTRNEHSHTSAAVPLPGNGMAVITSIGDSQPRNRVVNQRRSDQDYLAPGWSTNERFHGSRFRDLVVDPEYGTWSDDGVHNEEFGTEGNQFVGCAPGTMSGDILVGGDLTSEQIMRIPASEMLKDHPNTEHVFGLSVTSGNNRSEVFLIRTPTPEHGGPYFARYSPLSQGGDTPAAARRVLYSENGTNWAQVWQPQAGNFQGAVHGEHIYTDSFINSFGIRRMALPQLLHRQPLRVGAGGMQRAVAEPEVISGPDGELTLLQRNMQGQWLHEGEVLSPQPPCAGMVYHVTASRFFDGEQAGRLKVCGESLDIGDAVPGNALQMRCWVMNNAPGVTMHPGLEMRDQGGKIQMLQRPVYASVDRWFPVLGIRSAVVSDNAQVVLRVLASAAAGADDADFFLALDSVVEGVGAVDYALPPDQSPGGTGSWFPDEMASITGFQCTSTWTVTLAGQLPLDSWDGSIESTGLWPLVTLWGDASNYIELSASTADPEDSRVLAVIVRDGVEAARLESEPTYLLRGSPLLVSLSDAGDGLGVRMSISTGGQAAHDATVVGGGFSASPRAAPNQIRLSSHHGTQGDGTEVRVSPMLWWGGEVRETDFLNSSARLTLLQTLAFLGDGKLRGDLDADGDVDQSDLAILLASYQIDSGGDVDNDGDTDQQDMGILLSNYGFGASP